MNTHPKVAIVILNWNGVNHLRQFLPSVLSSVWPNLEIVVGDNASTDGSVAFIRDNYPSITIIQNDANYGFTGGYNRILQHVEADYYILLNSDVEVHPGWIAPVIELMESDPLIAVAAPKIKSYLEKECFEHAGAAGGFIDSFGYPFCRGRIVNVTEADKGQYEQSGEVFWASGASMFIKKECWDEAEGFDEQFFAHMEEIDLCWRLKNKGYKVMYCAESEIFHVGGGTLTAENPFKTYLNFRNNLLLIKKNLPFWKGAIVIISRFFLDFAALLRFLTEGKRKDAWAVSRAHRYFMLHIFESGEHASNSHLKKYNSKLTGMYHGSIMWSFFIKKLRKFTDLDLKRFY
ncbi:MAG: glycosyltransferase family 2 protein [Bacteroidota bacterium]